MFCNLKIVSLRNNGKFEEIGRTETIWDKSNVEFERTIVMDYFFEKEQLLKFEVYDCDDKNNKDLSKHDFLGYCTMTLGEMIHSPGSAMMQSLLSKKTNRPLKNKKVGKYQRIIVRTEQINDSVTERLQLGFIGKNLPKMDSFLGKVDPYFRICKVNKDIGYKLKDYETRSQMIQYKSEIVKREYNPKWKPFIINRSKLFYYSGNNNSKNNPKNNDQGTKQFEVQIWDWDNNSDDDFIGSVLITENDLNEIKKTGKEISYTIDLFDTKLKQKYSKQNKNKQPTLILSFVGSPPSLIDYLQGGSCDFSLMVAVDYTGSNGSGDLHHIENKNKNSPSDYQRAIRCVGNILQTYDSDQMYPLFGFGANGRFSGSVGSSTRHGFNVNTEMLKLKDEEVSGIYGLEQAYLASTNLIRNGTFSMSGPTNFATIIKNAKNIANGSFNKYKKNSKKNKLSYFILMIITDGEISDMNDTMNEIKEISNKGLPLSIIIIGVGSASFRKMEELDGDDDDSGKLGDRDIVDFVQFNLFDKVTLKDKSGKTLETKTLEEIPNQFLEFTQIHNIVPSVKIKQTEEDLEKYYGLKRINTEKSMNSSINVLDFDNPNIAKDYQNRNIHFDNAPLPPDWKRFYMPDGKCYYANKKLKLKQFMVCVAACYLTTPCHICSNLLPRCFFCCVCVFGPVQHPDDPSSPQKKLT